MVGCGMVALKFFGMVWCHSGAVGVIGLCAGRVGVQGRKWMQVDRNAGGGVGVMVKCGCLRRTGEEGGDKDRVCNAMRRGSEC